MKIFINQQTSGTAAMVCKRFKTVFSQLTMLKLYVITFIISIFISDSLCKWCRILLLFLNCYARVGLKNMMVLVFGGFFAGKVQS